MLTFRATLLAIAVLFWAGSQAPAGAACLDGRFLVTGASPLGTAGADSEVIDLVAGMVGMRGGCAPVPAMVLDAGARTRLVATWPACGAASDVVLKVRILGSECQTLRGSLRATRDGMRRARRVRAVRVEPIASTIVPKPVAAWQSVDGGTFLVTPRTKVLVEPDRPDVAHVAEQLVALLARQGVTRGAATAMRGRRQPRNSVLLTTQDADPTLGREGYVLRVSPSRVILRAPTSAGLLYAVQSLRQLLPVELDGPLVSEVAWAIPAMAVDDQPRFGWRGFMLDVSRTFSPIASLYRWVDLLALHKLNVFQLHLTDDQGWRIESEALPMLHQDGSTFDPVLAPNEIGGYYTRSELVDLVRYAAARNVEIVPEIDLPGHAGAMLHAIPDLACEFVPGVPRLASEFPIVPWGMILSPPPAPNPATLCVCDPFALAATELLVDEVAAIFPSRYLHFGGDEVATGDWSEGHLCPGLVASEGLDGVGDLQAWFFKRVEDMVRARGRVLIAWDEVQQRERPVRPSTTLSDAFTTMHWRTRYTSPTLFDRDVVQATAGPLYLDLGFIALDATYAYEPIPVDATPDQAAHVLGVQASMWTQLDRTQPEIEHRVFPRLGAVAEVAWTPPARKSFPGFEARWDRHVQRLDLLGVVR